MLGRIKRGLLDALFPPRITCICCDGELSDDAEREFCVCRECAKELEDISDKSQEITNDLLGFSSFHAVFKYCGPAKKLIVGYKDGNKSYLGEYMADLMYDTCKKNGVNADCLAFVPASKKKLAARGYDHMKLIAAAFAKRSGLPPIEALKRIGQGDDQTESEDRYANIKGQFALTDAASAVRNKCVLLLDDVVTTGATASECSKLLIGARASEVTLLTFAEAASFSSYKYYSAKRMSSSRQ